MKKILSFPYDGGERCPARPETRGEFSARAFHAPVSVVSVVPDCGDSLAGDASIDASARAHGLQEAKRPAAMGIDVEVLEPSGDPARRIEQIAEQGGFDTIVIGSGDGTPINRAFRGSVSGVVAHAAATVVVAH